MDDFMQYDRQQLEMAARNKIERERMLANNPRLQKMVMGGVKGLTGEMMEFNNFEKLDVESKSKRLTQNKKLAEAMCEEFNNINEKSMQNNYISQNQYPMQHVQGNYQDPRMTSARIQEVPMPQPISSLVEITNRPFSQKAPSVNDYIGIPEKKETQSATLSDVVAVLSETNEKLEMVCQLLGTLYKGVNVHVETLGKKIDTSNDCLRTLVSNIPVEDNSWDEPVPYLPVEEEVLEIDDTPVAEFHGTEAEESPDVPETTLPKKSKKKS